MTAPPATRSLAETLLGVLGGAMVLAAAVLALAGGPSDGAASAAPRIEMVQPSAGAAVQGPVDVVFNVEREITRMPGGWGVDSLHLHLLLDGIALMPGPTDIERVGDGRYRWRLPELDPGEHSLRLFWADAQHRPLTDGQSPALTVRAR